MLVKSNITIYRAETWILQQEAFRLVHSNLVRKFRSTAGQFTTIHWLHRQYVKEIIQCSLHFFKLAQHQLFLEMSQLTFENYTHATEFLGPNSPYITNTFCFWTTQYHLPTKWPPGTVEQHWRTISPNPSPPSTRTHHSRWNSVCNQLAEMVEKVTAQTPLLL